MLAIAAIINVSSGLGYALPAIIGLESLGIPSPGETSLVLAAVLANQGKLNIVLVIVIAAASAIVGDNIGYLLGRHYGRDVLEGPGPFQARRRKMITVGDRYFRDHGAKTVFIGRWIALIRFATAWLAGINGMRFVTFFCWNALGGITWATAYGLAGYYGGKTVTHIFERVGVIAAVVLVVAAALGYGYLKLREHRARGRSQADDALGLDADVEAFGGSAAVPDDPTSAEGAGSPRRTPSPPS
jgi:membrane protein DedA with SNARE-associated domain